MRAQIVPVEGGQPIELAKDLTLFGRAEDCDIRLEHKSVSKHHCVIVKTDGVLLLRDLGSTNGTRVNGTRVRRAVLLPNDKVSVANRHFRALFGAVIDAGEPEQTVHIDASSLAAKFSAKPAGPLEDSEHDVAPLEVQHNALPDVYPDDGK